MTTAIISVGKIVVLAGDESSISRTESRRTPMEPCGP
jgi:hypothetical protein